MRAFVDEGDKPGSNWMKIDEEMTVFKKVLFWKKPFYLVQRTFSNVLRKKIQFSLIFMDRGYTQSS